MNTDVVKLGEITSITKLAGFEFTKYFNYNQTGEIIALRALNLRNGKLDLTDIHRIDKSISDKLPRSKLYKGDIYLHIQVMVTVIVLWLMKMINII